MSEFAAPGSSARVNVVARLYEIDRMRFTCAGGSAALDLFQRTHAKAEEAAARIAELLPMPNPALSRPRIREISVVPMIGSRP